MKQWHTINIQNNCHLWFCHCYTYLPTFNIKDNCQLSYASIFHDLCTYNKIYYWTRKVWRYQSDNIIRSRKSLDRQMLILNWYCCHKRHDRTYLQGVNKFRNLSLANNTSVIYTHTHSHNCYLLVELHTEYVVSRTFCWHVTLTSGRWFC